MSNDYPLTPCQTLLWRSQTTSPSCPLFNQVVTIALPPTLTPDNDVQRWARAWQEIQRLHPVLTTRFTLDDSGKPQQRASEEFTRLLDVQIQAEPDQCETAFSQWIDERKMSVFALDIALTDIAYLRHSANSPGTAHTVMLYLNMHHLIADARSTVLVWQDLERIYLKLLDGSASLSDDSTLKDTVEHVNFFDYLSGTRWPANTIASSIPGQHTSNNDPNDRSAVPLKRAHYCATIPFYGYVNNDPDTVSRRFSVPLSESERQQFVTLSVDSQKSLISSALHQSVLHLTVFAIYLHRVTDDKDIIIEMPLLGRFGKRWQNTAGNFIEMIQVKVGIKSDDTVAKVYRTASEALIDTLKLVGPGCSASLETRSVHGVLNIITAATEAVSQGNETVGGKLTWHHPQHSDMRHPLRLHVADWNSTGVPSIELDINTACFAMPQRSFVAEHIAAIYRALLAAHDKDINAIPILAAGECWNLNAKSSSAIEHPENLLYQRISDMATRTPDNTAMVENQQQLSYAQLLAQASYVRQHLHALDIGVGDRVAVHMQRGLNLPIVLLGVLGSGAAYIPIDVSQPISRVEAILSDAQAKALIVDSVQQNLNHTCPLTLIATTILSTPAVPSNTNTQTAKLLSPSANHTAYVMYTSGSTGTPKGVAVSHGALISYLGWAEEYYRLPTAINMPLFTSVGFDLTVTSLYLPWLSGGTLFIYPQAETTDALTLFSVVDNTAINTVKLTPAHLALLLETEKQLNGAVQLIVGGEDLKNSTAIAIQSRAPHRLKIVNEYGPTEATVGCIAHRWNNSDTDGSVPIGFPIKGMSAYVLNSRGWPQFEGMVGELYLAGSSLADGYWNNVEQTQTAFVSRSAIAGKRLYRTGDLSRIENGEFVYLGRKDTQVSIHGHRVELSEIESVAMEHPAVSQCITRLRSPLTAAQPESIESSSHEYLCVDCGLSSRYPGADIDSDGMCSLCRHYSPNKERIETYFRAQDDLIDLIRQLKSRRRGKYDAVVLLSGGKDSTYALCQLVDLGLSVYAFSLDNGYLSEQALQNIDSVCERLGVDHYYARTEHMDNIFRDSLTRYSNVCHGCFKTIYNLSMSFAAEHQIDTIFTGLSRGQLFETRFNNELFSEKTFPISQLDDMVVAARIQYHAIKDAPNTLLDIENVNDGTLPERINIVDFYRYWHVEMADMLSYLKKRIDWIRPPDTGRSTNCLINDVGIYIHKKEQGFHNYSLPYSWDVRLGHKERSEAMEELDDDIDIDRVESILSKIGYEPFQDQTSTQQIEACFTTSSQLEPQQLRQWLQDKLPGYMLPARLLLLEEFPLNLHGKVDREKAFEQNFTTAVSDHAAPADVFSAMENRVAKVWLPYLASNITGREDNFFQLGGDSQAAIRCVMDLRKQGYNIEPADLFRKPLLRTFADFLDQAGRIEETDNTEKNDKFSHLSDVQREKLKKLLERKR